MRILLGICLLLIMSSSVKAKEFLAKLTSWQYQQVKQHIKEHVFQDIYLLEYSVTTAKLLKKQGTITYLEPNYNYFPLENSISLINFSPADELYKKQWALHPIKGVFRESKGDINIEEAWNNWMFQQEVVVAVIDSGIDINHPDLRENIWINELEFNGVEGVDDDGNGYVDDIYGQDFRNHRPLTGDDYGHGTHCAGVIGAVHNEQGIAGIMPRVKLMGLKFFSADGGSTADAIKAIHYAVDNGAKIISNSWGGYERSELLREAIEYAQQHGVLFIAAAGNDGTDNDKHPLYPASYNLDNIITVGAITSKAKRWSFSNYGHDSVDIFAPGKNVISTVPYAMYEKMSGTSMATPHVAGVAGLLWSQNSSLNFNEIKTILLQSAHQTSDLSNKSTAGGYLDAGKVLQTQ